MLLPRNYAPSYNKKNAIVTDDKRFTFDVDEKIRLHKLLLEKCHARDVFPSDISLEQEEIIRRAKSEWHTLELEIGEVPDFDECFHVVTQFYKSLPWGES